jgi:hypothetical protein
LRRFFIPLLLTQDITDMSQTAAVWIPVSTVTITAIITEDPMEDPTEDPTEDPMEDPTEDPMEDFMEDPWVLATIGIIPVCQLQIILVVIKWKLTHRMDHIWNTMIMILLLITLASNLSDSKTSVVTYESSNDV